MRRLTFLLLGIFLLSLTSVSSTESWKYNYLDQGEKVQSGANYSINVNNTEHFDGYTLTEHRSWLQTFFNGIYASISDLADYLPLSGGIMTGHINMSGNDIQDVDDMWVDGTFRSGIDGNVFVYDIYDEIHHLGADLQKFDELRSNVFTTPLTLVTIHNSTGDYINITATDGGKLSFISVEAGIAKSDSFDPGSHILELTSGTNETPVLNRIYAYISGDSPHWGVSTTEPVIQHASVARILLGDAGGLPYTAALQEDGMNGFLKRVQRRFRKEGLLYESGFDYLATADDLEITNGSYLDGIYDNDFLNTINVSEGFYHVHTDGTYHWLAGFDSITTYSNDAPIGTNKYFNVVWGITPFDGDGNLFAVVQDEPNTEYTSTTLAWADSDNVMNVYPSEDFLKLNFVPVAKTIIKKGDSAQLLPNGAYAEDYRGGVAGGASSGGGLSEVDPVWTVDKPNYLRNDENANLTDYNITANYFFGNASQMTGIPEPDLSSYLENIVEDTTPQLGGNLDGQSYNITTTGTGNFGDLRVNEDASKFIYIEGPYLSGKGISLYSANGALGQNSGGLFILKSGAGGNGNGGSWSASGSGGQYLMESGRGGSVAVAGTSGDIGGRGGKVTFNSGSGGSSTLSSSNLHFGGEGGEFEFTSGRGGSALNGASNFGGKGGKVSFISGAGGAGTTSPGAGGDMFFTTGVGYGTADDGYIQFKIGYYEVARFLGDASGLRFLDNKKVILGTSNDFEQYFDGTNTIYNNTNGGLHYFDGGNISVTGINYHTEVDNSSTALEWFKDGNDLLYEDGTPNHKAFGECYVNETHTDYSRPVEVLIELWAINISGNIKEMNTQEKEEFLQTPYLEYLNYTIKDISYYQTTYPHKTYKDAISGECMYAKQNQALANLNEVATIINTPQYGKVIDFDDGIMTENIWTQSKVINPLTNYALKFLNTTNLDSKDTHKNKEILILPNKTTEVLNMEDRIVDLEGAFSDHMTCTYLHKKYADYRDCMLDINPKEKIK